MSDPIMTVATVSSAVVAGAAAVITGFSAWTSKKQLELQSQAEIARTSPYVWADIRPRDADGQLLQLIVGNSGPTVATNVRVHVDAEIPHASRHSVRIQTALHRFNEGHASLPPGRTHAWALGTGIELLSDEETERRVTLTITADGPNGPVAPLRYSIDMNDWRETLVNPVGSLYRIEEAIKESGHLIAKKIGP